MASPRLSASPAAPSATAETWAIRISFGLMMAGMAGFVIYDLVQPGPASAAASTEEVEPAAEEPPVEPAAAAPPTADRRPPNRFSRLKNLPAPPSEDSEPAPAAEVAPDPVERRGELLGVRDRSSLRTFLGTPRVGQRHDDRAIARTDIRRIAAPEPPPTEPVPAPPPAHQPVDPPEQLVEQQPEPEQPVEQPEGQPSPTDEPN
jgi:hypothetical protein